LSMSVSSRAPAKHSSSVDAGSTELSIGESSWVGAAAQPRGAVSAAAAVAVAAVAAAAAVVAAVAARGCAAARSAACLKRCTSARARSVCPRLEG
jgi:hypothetical protein